MTTTATLFGPATSTPSGTGRISGTLGSAAHRVVYGPSDPEGDIALLQLTSQVDLAHVVMLAEVGLLAREHAAALVRAVHQLSSSGYATVLAAPRPRGLYLAYEAEVCRVAGADVGGRLHTGRSRNDLNATTHALRARSLVQEVRSQGIRLQAALLSRGRRHRHDVMPVHTHFQPAMPITFGYYLTGIALAMSRHLEGLEGAAVGFGTSPLGAHAVAGSDLPLDSGRTARLLGFASGPPHATDAVASRDVAVRCLGEAALLGVLVSRLATDLQLWSSMEFGYITFPDELVGSSSAMPQKRNAFLLEHLKARPAAAIGAWTAAASAMRSTPFTNTIEVGTEGVAGVYRALADVRDVLRLARLVVSGLRVEPERMEAAARRGFVLATAAANELVRAGVPFREAHHDTGVAVSAAIARGDEQLEIPGVVVPSHTEAVVAMRYGGGPGAIDEAIALGCTRLRDRRAALSRDRRRADEAATALAVAVGRLLAQEPVC
jgi:argininosuccinate lyase